MATLKISDLSVGDWVEFKGELCKVLECGAIIVSPRTIEFKPRLILSAKYDIYDCVDVDKVRPIPITAEILEKNGFVRSTSEFIVYHTDNVWISYDKPSETWSVTMYINNVTSNLHANILHIHQLQHALRLAEVDKEINLL